MLSVTRVASLSRIAHRSSIHYRFIMGTRRTMFHPAHLISAYLGGKCPAIGQSCILAGMAYDEWEHEYHLTPNGWVTGSFSFRGTLAKKVPIPIDKVMTMVQENFNSTSCPLLQTSWRQGWLSCCCSLEKIDRLFLKFGYRPPEQITFRLEESRDSVQDRADVRLGGCQ